MSFATRLTVTEIDLAETKAKLYLVKTKVESLEAQIIALHGLAHTWLFDPYSMLPLDPWARSLGNVEEILLRARKGIEILRRPRQGGYQAREL